MVAPTGILQALASLYLEDIFIPPHTHALHLGVRSGAQKPAAVRRRQAHVRASK
jgi:hypothetical protein